MRYSNFQLLSTGFRSCTNYTKVRTAPFLTRTMATAGTPSDTARLQKDQTTQAPGDYGIENTNISTASGVNLDSQQKVLVGSVLDVTPPNMYIAL